MNEDLKTGLAVAAAVSVAVAVAAGVVLDGSSDVKPDERPVEAQKEDPRPIIDDKTIRLKASPTSAEQGASKPGRLRDGGSVVWTLTSSYEQVRIAAPCRIPNCWLADGGWDDEAVVDCRATGTHGLPDGGPRWNGCNVIPASVAVGAACVPVACSVWAGDDPTEVLKP